MEIHELNTFSGTPGAGDFLATDNGTDTAKIAIKTITDPLNARIDNIIAGPASSAQEVIDARLGADGVTYPSLGDAIRGQVTDLKSDLKNASLDAVSFEVLPTRTYTINTVDAYKNAFITFPLTVGKTYTIANKSSSAYIAVFSCTNAVSSPSSDVQTLAAGLNAGRSTTVKVTSDANYLRVYCTATPAVMGITVSEAMRYEVDEHTEVILSKLTDNGDVDVSHIENMAMSTACVLYASSGSRVAYAKVFKGWKISFYSDNNGTTEATDCRFGFFSTIPSGGSSPDLGYDGAGKYYAVAPQDCYIAFTRPSRTTFSATFENTASINRRTTTIEDDLYGIDGTLTATMLANTAINANNGHYFEAQGWTAGKALAKAGSYLVFKADGVITNCRYTVFRDSVAYENIVSFGTDYGAKIPDDADYWIMASAPSVITQFTFEYERKGIADYAEGYWHGKKIVWFGTSIPAGVVNAGGSNGIGSYPERLGRMLGAKVYNEAVGSSRVRSGNYELATADDPLGYAGNSPIGILLSLSLSSSEKQSFIDDWDTKWSNIVSDPSGTMSNLTPELIQFYKDTSWDIKLAKYLSGGSVGQCDLYVFDHGFNDAVEPDMFDNFSDDPPTSDPTNRGYWLGAMGFLFKKILDDNPKARILIIGHYMNAPTQGTSGQYLIKNGIDKCCAGQVKLAEKWGIPIIKTWEYMRISNNIINNGGTDMPVLFAYFPDGIHPASDTSGYALQYYADVLYPHIKDIG